MKTLLYVAAMTGLFTLPSCLKNDPAAPADTIGFPSTQGDYWVYKVTNYQNNTIDTVTVSVVGSMKDTIQAGNFTILQLKWPDKIDSQYVSVVNDTLSFYKGEFDAPQFNYVMTNLIIYPLSIGKNYSISRQNVFYTSDSVRMISSESMDINLNKTIRGFTAFREEKTFLLNTLGPRPYFLIFTDDFVPGIGIIKETMTRRGGYANVQGSASMIIETWQLLYSNLNNPPSSGSVNP